MKEKDKAKGRPRKIDFNMNGEKTRKKLKKLKIVSPPTQGKVLIGKGIWVVPNKKFKNEKAKQEWIACKRYQLNIITL